MRKNGTRRDKISFLLQLNGWETLHDLAEEVGQLFYVLLRRNRIDWIELRLAFH